jgi:hypothetical protein
MQLGSRVSKARSRVIETLARREDKRCHHDLQTGATVQRYSTMLIQLTTPEHGYSGGVNRLGDTMLLTVFSTTVQ